MPGIQAGEERGKLQVRQDFTGVFLRKRIGDLGIEEVLTAYRSPWQNPYCERWIGTARRDCLDHVIVWNEAHLRRTLHEFLSYYHADRTHHALANDRPESRPVEPRSLVRDLPLRALPRVVPGSSVGRVVELPRVGGLHHRYTRLAA